MHAIGELKLPGERKLPTSQQDQGCLWLQEASVRQSLCGP